MTITIILYIIIIILLLYYLFNNTYEYYSNNNVIPKIIIQTWKSHDIPDKYKDDIQSIKDHNKDYNIMLFSDEDIIKFLKTNYPKYYESFIKLPINIQKIDYFRYIAIYHYGGFYFDLDITSFKSLDDLLNKNCIFPVDTHMDYHGYDNERYKPYENKINILLGQYAFAAAPKHPFIKLLIDNIHNNIDKYIEESKTEYGKTLNYVYKTTGPDYVTDMYLLYLNNNKNDITILEHPLGQFFGNYAKHNYYGTWK